MNSINESLISERGTNMKRTHLIAALVGIVAMSIFAADASAMYHPGMGTFMSRDPGAGGANRVGAGGAPAATGQFIPRDPTGSNQYADGMNLYQYVRSNPVQHVDPYGQQAKVPPPNELNNQISAWFHYIEGSGKQMKLSNDLFMMAVKQPHAERLIRRVAEKMISQLPTKCNTPKTKIAGWNDSETVFTAPLLASWREPGKFFDNPNYNFNLNVTIGTFDLSVKTSGCWVKTGPIENGLAVCKEKTGGCGCKGVAFCWATFTLEDTYRFQGTGNSANDLIHYASYPIGWLAQIEMFEVPGGFTPKEYKIVNIRKAGVGQGKWVCSKK